MDEVRLLQLLAMRGPDFPPVANALSKLPDDHPLKIAALEEHPLKIAALEERTEPQGPNLP
jgi:ureidoglycolate hydrolase